MFYDAAKQRYLLRGDMHIHTEYSDGAPLAAVLVEAVNRGLDFIAIADHDTMDGSLAAQRLVREMQLPLLIVPAIEISGPGAHLLGYDLKSDPRCYGSIRDICRQVREAGGKICAAHPCWEGTRKSIWENGLFQELAANGEFDAFELVNGSADTLSSNNGSVIDFYRRETPDHAITAGSDAHCLADVGNTHLAVWCDTADVAGILTAVFRKKTAAAWFDGQYAGPAEWPVPPDEFPPRFEFLPELRTTSDAVGGTKFEILLPEMPERLFLPPGISAGKISPTDGKFRLTLSPANPFLPFSLPTGFQFPRRRYRALLLKNEPVLNLKLLPGIGKMQLELTGNAPWPLADFRLKFQTETGETDALPVPSLAPKEKLVLTFKENPLLPDGKKHPLRFTAENRSGVPLYEEKISFPLLAVPRDTCGSWQGLAEQHLNPPRPDGREAETLFRTGWNHEFLTLEFQVRKENFCQPYCHMACYMGDSVQLGIDPGFARSKFNLLSRNVWELLLAETSEGSEIWVIASPEKNTIPIRQAVSPMMLSITRPTEKTQLYSLQIPWKLLELNPHPDLRIGFNCVVNVNDGNGWRGVHQWTSGIYRRKCAADWGVLLLR